MSEHDDFTSMWRQIENDLGMNDTSMKRDRPYNGQAHTDTGQRGATKIKGITFRDLRDCYIRAFALSAGVQFPGLHDQACRGEDAQLSENDVYGIGDDVDPIAVLQHMSCEIEKLMGIYPNIHRLACEEDEK